MAQSPRAHSWRGPRAGTHGPCCQDEAGGYEDAEDEDDGERRQVLHGGADCGKHDVSPLGVDARSGHKKAPGDESLGACGGTKSWS